MGLASALAPNEIHVRKVGSLALPWCRDHGCLPPPTFLFCRIISRSFGIQLDTPFRSPSWSALSLMFSPGSKPPFPRQCKPSHPFGAQLRFRQTSLPCACA
jgi:hypothetical protein